MEAHPEAFPEIFEETVELDAFESERVAFYFRMRRSTKPDEPVSLEAALRLYERLYGDVDALQLVEQIEAMDSEFMAARITRRPSERGRG